MYMRCEVTLIVRVFFYFYTTNIVYSNASITLTFTSLPHADAMVGEFKEEPRSGPRAISVLRVGWPPLSQSDPTTVRKAVRVTSPRPRANRRT